MADSEPKALTQALSGNRLARLPGATRGTLVLMIGSHWRLFSRSALIAVVSLIAAACGTSTPTALEVPTQLVVPATTAPVPAPAQPVPATTTATATATATASAVALADPTSGPTSAPDATPTVTAAPTAAPTAVPTQTPTPTSAPTATPEPTPDAVAVGYGRECLVHDDVERCWSLQTSGLDTPRPLVIDLHGWGGSGEQQRGNSKLDIVAEAEHFVAVWPEGRNGTWNAGTECCGSSSARGIDDVAFLRTLIASVVEAHHVDPDRVYLTGYSNGCAMAQRMAAEASDLIAAVACTSLFRLVPVSADYTPVPILEMHGVYDEVVFYEPNTFEGAPLAGAINNLESWASINDCSGEPTEAAIDDHKVQRTYVGCAGGAEVALVTANNGFHNLYILDDPPTTAAQLMWNFLRRFSR